MSIAPKHLFNQVAVVYPLSGHTPIGPVAKEPFEVLCRLSGSVRVKQTSLVNKEGDVVIPKGVVSIYPKYKGKTITQDDIGLFSKIILNGNTLSVVEISTPNLHENCYIRCVVS